MVDWNEAQDIAQKFKGFFQIEDGGTFYRYKQLQELEIITAADIEKHYSDSGFKTLDSLGDSSTFRLVTKKTADLWDTTPLTSTTQERTIGFLQNQIINDRIIPLLTFEGVNETEAASNSFIVQEFTAFVLNIQGSREPSAGADDIEISGEIQTMTVSQRQASA
jgi:hypothetical protein